MTHTLRYGNRLYVRLSPATMDQRLWEVPVAWVIGVSV